MQKIICFSYDSNRSVIQYIWKVIHALHVGLVIAKKNGKNLSKFISDFKKRSPTTKIRLIGHSLGTHVILNTILNLSKKSFPLLSITMKAGKF